MDGEVFSLIEVVLGFMLVLAFGIYELRSLASSERDRRAERERDKSGS